VANEAKLVANQD
jgi:hypothetical protein